MAKNEEIKSSDSISLVLDFLMRNTRYQAQIQKLNTLQADALPQLIICRAFDHDRDGDKTMLEVLCPEILKDAVFLESPRDIYSYLKEDRPNVVFLGYYFHDGSSLNGSDVAKEMKSRNYPVRTVLITSVENPYIHEGSFDMVYASIDSNPEEFFSAKYLTDNIVAALTIPLPNQKEIKKFGKDDVIDFVLGVLHELSDAEKIEELFAQAIEMGYANQELLLSLQKEYIELLPLQSLYSNDPNDEKKKELHEAIRDKMRALTN